MIAIKSGLLASYQIIQLASHRYRVGKKPIFLPTADQGIKLIQKGLEMYCSNPFDFIHLPFILICVF